MIRPLIMWVFAATSVAGAAEMQVELLGGDTCHTDGALEGVPSIEQPLAGLNMGIAFTAPLLNYHPGVVFPPNITPDIETGIGGWSDEQLSAAIRQGRGRHGVRQGWVMPWPGYARLSDEDTDAIVKYLRSLEPVEHQVPENTEAGEPIAAPFIYFGAYIAD